MFTAPIGWASDRANVGFLRDEEAVLVLFFTHTQDEADQSSEMIDGTSTETWVLGRVAEAKAGCDGLRGIVAGGLLEEVACMGGPVDLGVSCRV